MENVLWIRVSTVTAIFDGHINGGKLDYPQWSAVITALPQIPKGLSCNLYICPFVLSGPSIHQSVCPDVRSSIYLSVCLSVLIYVSIHISTNFWFIYSTIHLFICISFFLFCIFISIPIYLSFFLSIYLSMISCVIFHFNYLKNDRSLPHMQTSMYMILPG